MAYAKFLILSLEVTCSEFSSSVQDIRTHHKTHSRFEVSLTRPVTLRLSASACFALSSTIRQSWVITKCVKISKAIPKSSEIRSTLTNSLPQVEFLEYPILIYLCVFIFYFSSHVTLAGDVARSKVLAQRSLLFASIS